MTKTNTIEKIQNAGNPITTGTVITAGLTVGAGTTVASAAGFVVPVLIATGIGAAVGGKKTAVKTAKVSAAIAGGLSLTTGVIAGAGTALGVNALRKGLDNVIENAAYDFEDGDDEVA